MRGERGGRSERPCRPPRTSVHSRGGPRLPGIALLYMYGPLAVYVRVHEEPLPGARVTPALARSKVDNFALSHAR